MRWDRKQSSQPSDILVDPEDEHLLTERTWTVQKCRRTNYAIARIDGSLVRLHRLIMNAPEGLDVDHRNGNGLDNRKANLRLANRSQNGANRAPNTGQKFKGVSYRKAGGKWQAKIQIDGHRHHLGYFETPEAAALAYNAAALEAWGEFAYLNEVET